MACDCDVELEGLLQANKMQAETVGALRAQVARLEAAIETKDEALEILLHERNSLGKDEPVWTLDPAFDIARAALSPDAGKGWLPPDKVAPIRAFMGLFYVGEHGHRSPPEQECFDSGEFWGKFNAALDALEVK